jgi:hypothetical protein
MKKSVFLIGLLLTDEDENAREAAKKMGLTK